MNPTEPSNDPSAAARQHARSRIHKLARDARLAVGIQLVVAVIAVLATVFFGWRIREATEQLSVVEKDLATKTQALKSTSQRVAVADDATRAVLAAAAAAATREPDRYTAAIASLETVKKSLADASAEFEEQSARASIQPLRDVRMAVNGALARVLFGRPDRKAEDIDRAIALADENLREPGIDAKQRYENTVALASFQCERGDRDAVRALLDERFVAANPQVGANGVLPEACRAMAALAAPVVPAFDATRADPAYRLRSVYLHIAAESDRLWAASLAQSVCDAGYDVPGIQRVEASKFAENGQVVYYYDAQAAEAASLAARVGSPWKRAPAIRRLTGFANLDKHTVELWLPALERNAPPPPSADALRRFKSCLSTARNPRAVDALVAQLISDSRQDRVGAGQSLAIQIRGANDGEAISALLSQLEGQALDRLSATGRLNVLYMLNLEPSWSDRPEKDRLVAALAAIRTRSQARGIAIGSQTEDCLNKLAAKIAKQSAADRCGGL
ncbi:hypothetical protein [Aquabacterium humicola]|uniref:hypothetical protein n=1 Tax=Aquabacterium humicola TaxID=3237377 RepID=UPI0025438AF0|nr:hypothetical protein [Rubrivivax pictus]